MARLLRTRDYPPDNLDQVVSFGDYTRLCLAVEDFYGRAARGMLECVGRASFRYGLQEHSTLFKAAQLYLKVRQPRARLEFVLDAMAKGLIEEANEPIHVQENGDDFILNICSV
jgi:hypothetical protein